MATTHTTINIETTTLKRLARYCGRKLRRSAVLTELVDEFLDEKQKETGKVY